MTNENQKPGRPSKPAEERLSNVCKTDVDDLVEQALQAEVGKTGEKRSEVLRTLIIEGLGRRGYETGSD